MTDPIKNLIAAAEELADFVRMSGYEGTADMLRRYEAAAERAAKPATDYCPFASQRGKIGQWSCGECGESGSIFDGCKAKPESVKRPDVTVTALRGQTIDGVIIDEPDDVKLPEPKRDRLPPKFWTLLDELKLTGDRRAYEALEMLGTAIESIEPKRVKLPEWVRARILSTYRNAGDLGQGLIGDLCDVVEAIADAIESVEVR